MGLNVQTLQSSQTKWTRHHMTHQKLRLFTTLDWIKSCWLTLKKISTSHSQIKKKIKKSVHQLLWTSNNCKSAKWKTAANRIFSPSKSGHCTTDKLVPGKISTAGVKWRTVRTGAINAHSFAECFILYPSQHHPPLLITVKCSAPLFHLEVEHTFSSL